MLASQPTFSLYPDADQNRKDALFISVVAYGAYIPLSHPIHFCPLPNQNLDKMPRSYQDTGTLDPRSEMLFTDFHGVQIISSTKTPVR